MTDHDHEFGPVETARFTGNPHRKCTFEGCNFITLDLSDDECDCADFEHCSSCHAWAVEQIERGFSPWSLEFIKPGDVVEPLPPKWY